MTDKSINGNKTCRTTQEHDKEQWPKFFFVHGFRQTRITARTEGFIDFPGVLSLNQDYMFCKAANQNHGRPGGHRI